MALKVKLVAFAHVLLDEIRELPALFTTIEGLHVDEDGFVLPLARGGVFLLVVDGKAKVGDFTAAGERSRFRVARQPSDEHHLVQVGHDYTPVERGWGKTTPPIVYIRSP